MLFRFAKFTFALFVLLCIARTALWTRNLLTQDGFLDASTTPRWFAGADVNFPNSTTIFPAHDEIVAAATRFFTLAISPQVILFLAALSAAIWLGGLGFTRLVRVYEDRYSGWPERF
jgi:hypothetical protein